MEARNEPSSPEAAVLVAISQLRDTRGTVPRSRIIDRMTRLGFTTRTATETIAEMKRAGSIEESPDGEIRRTFQ